MSNSLPFSKVLENGYTDRILEQRKVWEELYKIIKNKKAKALFILGDLFDRSKVDPITLKETVKQIVKSSVKTFILPGNHDASGDKFIVEAFGEIGNKRIKLIGNGDKPIKYGNIYFHSVSYRSIEDTEKAIKKIRLKKSGKNILLLHTSIVGAEYCGCACGDGVKQKFLKRFDFVLSGHFHNTHKFSDNGLYVGTPFRTSYGEKDFSTGVWNIDFDKDKFEYVEIDCPNFYTFDLDKIDDSKLKKNDFVRINVKCKTYEFASKENEVKNLISKYIENGIRAEYKHIPTTETDNRLGIDLSKKLNYSSIIKKYVELNNTGINSKLLINYGKKIIKEAKK